MPADDLPHTVPPPSNSHTESLPLSLIPGSGKR
jgi:hypothetical protein